MDSIKMANEKLQRQGVKVFGGPRVAGPTQVETNFKPQSAGLPAGVRQVAPGVYEQAPTMNPGREMPRPTAPVEAPAVQAGTRPTPTIHPSIRSGPSVEAQAYQQTRAAQMGPQMPAGVRPTPTPAALPKLAPSSALTKLGAAGVALGGAAQAKEAYAQSDALESGADRAGLALEHTSRLGGALVGGKLGVMAGGMTGPLAPYAAPVLGLAGGAAGYFAPEMVREAARSFTGDGQQELQLPSEKANKIIEARAGVKPTVGVPTLLARPAEAAAYPTQPVAPATPIEARNANAGIPVTDQRGAWDMSERGVRGANEAFKAYAPVAKDKTFNVGTYDGNATIYAQKQGAAAPTGKDFLPGQQSDAMSTAQKGVRDTRGFNGGEVDVVNRNIRANAGVNSFVGTGTPTDPNAPTQEQLVADKIAGMERSAGIRRGVHALQVAENDRGAMNFGRGEGGRVSKTQLTYNAAMDRNRIDEEQGVRTAANAAQATQVDSGKAAALKAQQDREYAYKVGRDRVGDQRNSSIDSQKIGNDDAQRRNASNNAFSKLIENQVGTVFEKGRTVPDKGTHDAVFQAVMQSLPEIAKQQRALGTPEAIAQADALEANGIDALNETSRNALIQQQLAAIKEANRVKGLWPWQQ